MGKVPIHPEEMEEYLINFCRRAEICTGVDVPVPMIQQLIKDVRYQRVRNKAFSLFGKANKDFLDSIEEFLTHQPSDFKYSSKPTKKQIQKTEEERITTLKKHISNHKLNKSFQELYPDE